MFRPGCDTAAVVQGDASAAVALGRRGSCQDQHRSRAPRADLRALWRQAPVMTLGLLVNIDVDDLARAEEFYCAALPLRVGRRFGQSAVELLGASSPVYLLAKAAGTAAFAANGRRRS